MSLAPLPYQYFIDIPQTRSRQILASDFADGHNNETNMVDTSHHITSRTLDTSREINEALRSQFETTRTHKSHSSKSSTMHISSGGDLESRCLPVRASDPQNWDQYHGENGMLPLPEGGDGAEDPLDVRVRVERVLIVEPNRALLLKEDYRRPRVVWDARS